MKVLLFTHEQDIDGMGSIIIGKLAFKTFDYITCKSFEVNQKVLETINNSSIYNYDYIYVTDICIKEPLLTQIDNDDQLRNKILILDHHKSEIDEGNDKYQFVNITIVNEKGKVSGTSLFYDYLINQGLLTPNNSCLKELVELTRQYDTWEWKEIYNNKKARMLHILFEQIGYKKYINEIMEIVLNESSFEFYKNHLDLINIFEKDLNVAINSILKDMVIYQLELNNFKYKIGFVQTKYQYRNELSEAVFINNVNNIDLIGMIILDKDSVSFRRIKDIDVSLIASYFGGKGHKEAAGAPKDNENFREIIELFG